MSQDTKPSASAKNLGVVFNSSFNFQKHVSQTCRACFYYILDLRRIRKSPSLDLVKQIAVTLVISKIIAIHFFTICQKKISLDYNCLARVVTKALRCSRSTPILKRLHCLPVKFRIHL